MAKSSENIALSAEQKRFSEIIGDLVEQWGFNRNLGRIWSLLYLCEAPQNPSQIQAALKLSAGAVSSALSELQTWGVIKRLRVAADRKYYYEADAQIWKSIANVLKARELRILNETIANLKELESKLGKSKDDGGTKYQVQRIEHVREAVDTAFVLASQLINTKPERLSTVSKLVARLRSL